MGDVGVSSLSIADGDWGDNILTELFLVQSVDQPSLLLASIILTFLLLLLVQKY